MAPRLRETSSDGGRTKWLPGLAPQGLLCVSKDQGVDYAQFSTSVRSPDNHVDTHHVRLVWTDPRTGMDYEIQSRRDFGEDVPWPGCLYLVTNRPTGERASFYFASLEGTEASLAGLVDVAEGLIARRSHRNGRRRRWGGRGRVWRRLVERARGIAWGPQPDPRRRNHVDAHGRLLVWKEAREPDAGGRGVSSPA